MQKCVSSHNFVWTAAIFLWKALILVYGLYLSWQIRNVAVPAMNDAVCLTVSIFSVMCVTCVVIGCVALFGDWPNAVCVIITFAVFTGAIVSQTMVFAPKVR